MVIKHPDEPDIFKLNFSSKTPFRKKLLSGLEQYIEKALSLRKMNLLYSYSLTKGNTDNFINEVLNLLNISYSVSESDLARIPKEGRVMVVSNHPFGGIEGVILGALLRSIRPDVKLMANYLLGRIPELRDLFFLVDPFESKEAAKKNIKPLRDSIKWLKDDKLLGIFPSGEVSYFHLQKREITDPQWSNTIARIIRKTETPVIPIYFEGTNSILFQVLGLIHSKLRTLLLPHELVNKKDRKVHLRVGQMIPYKRLNEFESDEEMVSYLRLKTYILGNRDKSTVEEKRENSYKILDKDNYEEVAPAIDSNILLNEINNLPDGHKIVENNEYEVYYGKAEQIPNVLNELGRLREITFRDTNEGTGKSTDLDQYDEYYYHLFIWNKEKNEVVGAYRLGLSEEIMDRFGKKGFYSSSLFKYRTTFINKIRPAIELGRSFIRLEYQRNYSSLLLLWKGIGQFVIKHPDYKYLFGPVSISSDYGMISQHLIVSFLKKHRYIPNLAKMVKAKTPLNAKLIKGHHLKDSSVILNDLEEVSELIADIETDQKGVPILLKQYLKLGGKLLGFNIDHDFGDVLDGLILVDLTQTERKLLERYMGKEGTNTFLTYHQALNNTSKKVLIHQNAT